MLKVDGLPEHILEPYLTGSEQDRFPWIRSLFLRQGVWVKNFYARGVSLSTTGWSQIDTGKPMLIRGNVEYDRYTLRPYDYLNFFPFYLGYAASSRVDMPGVELLDEYNIPLLLDRFPFEQRQQGFQLLQRGVNWSTLQSTLTRTIASRGPRELLDEFSIGLSMIGDFHDQAEADFLARLADPNVKYLDYYVTEFDHVSHLVRDPVSQRHVLDELDALIGRIWTVVQSTPLASKTALVLVSDHGMNTSPDIYSQGFSFVDWFRGAAGGRHHVLTNRHPLTEFTLKGLDPLVAAVVTPSNQSPYAADSEKYPTVMLDLDGNERASIGLRNNTFNVVHLLLEQLQPGRASGTTRRAALNALFELLDRVRASWTRDLNELQAELDELQRRIDALAKTNATLPERFTNEDYAHGANRIVRRSQHQEETWRDQHAEYTRYLETMRRLLALTPADFDPGNYKIEDLLPARSLGPLNTLADLENYVTGLGPDGLIVKDVVHDLANDVVKEGETKDPRDAELDWERSFTRMNYFDALEAIQVKNVVQPELGRRPVDFVAMRIPNSDLRSAWLQFHPGELLPSGGAVWLRAGEQRQALILARWNARGQRELRYVPVKALHQQPDEAVQFELGDYEPGLPLHIAEDPAFHQTVAWLSEWHTEREWLNAVHETRYSNGIVSLAAQLLEDAPDAAPTAPGFAPDSAASQDLLDRFLERKTRLRRTDLLVIANDHWNFNVRGFNPGGNHGSFLRPSTRGVLMMAGGEDTPLAHGVTVETPYDLLSVLPTVLNLMGRPEPDLPGEIIREAFQSDVFREIPPGPHAVPAPTKPPSRDGPAPSPALVP